MDFTILYRVLFKPNDVFKEFKERTRPEPFIFIGALVILSVVNAYRNDFQNIIEHPSLIPIGLLQGLFFSLLFPGIEALIVLLIARLLFKAKASFLSLVSAFILCSLPQYISSWLTMLFGYPAIYVGLGGLFTSLRETHPFLFGMVASITPFFIWVVFLWRAALKQIVTPSKQQTTALLSVLIIQGLTIGGLWRMFAVMIFNIFNPAK
jgi:hypothetical protein